MKPPAALSRRTVAAFLGVMSAGVLVGMLTDLIAPVGGLIDELTLLPLSPIFVALGGFSVPILDANESRLDFPLLHLLFLCGGLLYWPVLLALAFGWFRSRKRAWLLATFLWTVQGFFQVGHRYWVMSGV